MHSPRPVLVKAIERASPSDQPLPEKHQSPNLGGYRAIGRSRQRTRSRLTAWPQCMLPQPQP